MDKKLTGLMALFFLSFFVFVSLVLFNKPLSQFTRARENFQISAQKTLAVVWPLTLKSGGQEKSQIDVFVRSEANTPMGNRTVAVQSTLGTISPQTATTDELGKATFTLSSAQAGKADLSILIDNTVQATQRFSVVFE